MNEKYDFLGFSWKLRIKNFLEKLLSRYILLGKINYQKGA